MEEHLLCSNLWKDSPRVNLQIYRGYFLIAQDYLKAEQRDKSQIQLTAMAISKDALLQKDCPLRLTKVF